MRLVRVQDRLTSDEQSVWRINPRTGMLESRAGLSWTGVRDYLIGGKVTKVLHRPEQFNSPGFLRTLRRVPAAKGHPSGGRDVLTSNASELLVGYTGEIIDVEEHGGYSRPVGNASVFVPAVICEMMDRDGWDAYCGDFPEVAKLGLRHSGAPPKTGTSLGYNALWYGPHVEAEIVSERDDGSLVGEWMGPNGPERYDIEHIVDPECEVVRKLEQNTGFDPRVLGGQHFAVCLPALGGRGAEQSELMRVVDALDLAAIDPDHARRFARVAVQVPRMPGVRDATWTVGTSRELPVVPGDWDGDAAAASVFAWAGFDEGKPDPARACQAFLIYDADAPELKGSYKLPIARYRDGRLEVVKGGLDAAASYLPQTDAPQEALDRARAVLDHYYDKWRKQQPDTARDRTPTMKTPIEIGLGRDAIKALAKLNPAVKVPAPLTLALDEIDAEKLRMKLDEMASVFGDLMEMVSEAKGEAAGMEEKMADMMSVAEATKKVDEIKAMLAEAEKALAEAKAGEAEAAAAADKMKAACDALTAELAPFRAAEFKAFRDEAIARGIDKAKVEAAKDAAELRRTIVVAKLGDRYGKCRDDGSFVADDTLVQAAFDGVWLSLATSAKPTQSQSPTFANFPPLTLQRDAAPTQQAGGPSTKSVVKAGAVCL